MRIFGREAELDTSWARSDARNRHNGTLLEPSQACGREVACNPMHACSIRPVGRQIDLDDRIVQASVGGVGHADGGIGGQIDDAVVVA